MALMAYIYRKNKPTFAKAYCLRCARPQNGAPKLINGYCYRCVLFMDEHQEEEEQERREEKEKEEEKGEQERREEKLDLTCSKCGKKRVTPATARSGRHICNPCRWERDKKARKARYSPKGCSHCGLTAEEVGTSYKFIKGMCYKCYQYQRKNGKPKTLFINCSACGKEIDIRHNARIKTCSKECAKRRAYQRRTTKNLERFGLYGEPSWLYDKKTRRK